jgi:hypothetical protein
LYQQFPPTKKKTPTTPPPPARLLSSDIKCKQNQKIFLYFLRRQYFSFF